METGGGGGGEREWLNLTYMHPPLHERKHRKIQYKNTKQSIRSPLKAEGCVGGGRSPEHRFIDSISLQYLAPLLLDHLALLQVLNFMFQCLLLL